MSTQVDVNQELHAMAQSIAECLGGDWQYASEQQEHRAILCGPGGASISIGYAGFDRSRLDIFGRWPEPIRHRDAHTYQFYPCDRPAITVAVSRTPSSIARDIQRRLLPEYLILWAEAVMRRQAKLAELAELNRMTARLAQIPNTSIDAHRGGVNFGKYDVAHGSAEVHSDGTATLTIHNLPFEVACGVLERVLRKGGD